MSKRRCKPSEDVCLEHTLPLVTPRLCAERCPHARTFREIVRDSIMALGSIRVMTRMRCGTCQTWLPLGPANDSGEFAEAVAVEVRAAELAATTPALAHRAMNPAAVYAAQCGYDDKQPAFAWSCGWSGLERAYESGYLAHTITTHTEQREGEK